MQIKRILCYFLLFAVLFTGIPASVSAAPSGTSAEGEAILSYLGILDKETDGNGILTRKEAARLAVRLKQFTRLNPQGIFKDVDVDSEYAADIETAYQNGLVSLNASKTYRPDDAILPLEFVRMLLNALGYGPYLSYDQGLIYADSLGLLSGTDGMNISGSVSREHSIIMLANALETDLMMQVGVNGDGTGKFQVVKGKNILSEIYDIRKIKGVVTANEKTSIYSEMDSVSGLSINGVNYRCAPEYQAYLGYQVSAYVGITTEEIVFLNPMAKNKVLRLKSDDILPESTKTNLSYYNEEDRRISVRLSTSGSYLINDVYFANIDSGLVTDELFRRENSVFVLIDNNGDGIYELAFEEQYRYFQIKSVNKEEMVILDKITGAGIEISSKDMFRYRDGKVVSLEQLQYNDILGAKVPADFNFSDRMEGIDFLVLQDVVNGKATKTSDTAVSVNGENYRLNGVTASVLDGKTASFYLDANGRIVTFDLQNMNTGNRYLYFVGIDQPDGALGSVKAKVLDSADGLCVKELDEKASVYLDDEKLLGGAEKIMENKADIIGKVVKASFSSDGKVKRIDLPSELGYGKPGSKGDFNRISAKTYRKRGEDVFNDLYKIPVTAMAFVVPMTETDDEIYAVKTVNSVSMFEDIELELYNVDNEFQVGCILVRQKDASSGPVSAEGSLFVVEKTAQSILEDGTMTITAYGMYNGEYKGFQFLKEDAKAKSFDDNTDVYGAVKRRMTAKDIACGDILLLNLDGTSINSFRVLLDVSNDPDFARQGSDDWDDVADWPVDYAFVSKAMILTNGTVKAKDGSVMTYDMDIPGKHVYTKNSFVSGAQNIYLVDTERKKVSKITSSSMELKPGRQVFTTMVWGRERDLVVYR